jgi:hypothetical protein
MSEVKFSLPAVLAKVEEVLSNAGKFEARMVELEAKLPALEAKIAQYEADIPKIEAFFSQLEALSAPVVTSVESSAPVAESK